MRQALDLARTARDVGEVPVGAVVVRSIALPAMGAGYYGIAADLSARVMLEVIRDHLEAGLQPSHLSRSH